MQSHIDHDLDWLHAGSFEMSSPVPAGLSTSLSVLRMWQWTTSKTPWLREVRLRSRVASMLIRGVGETSLVHRSAPGLWFCDWYRVLVIYVYAAAL